MACTEEDKEFMSIAFKEALAAYREREVPVGAVIVYNGLVAAKAYNQCEALRDPTAHAEIQAIRKAASYATSWRLEGAVLYVTKEPCIMCSGAMVNARIARLVYGCHDPKGGAVTTLYQLLSDTRLNHQVQVLSGVMEKECAWLLSRFFRMLRNRVAPHLIVEENKD